jgi:hypothetical protein
MPAMLDSCGMCEHARRLVLAQSAHDKDWSWANICPVFASGVDCMTDQAGIVDEILLKPVDLGNVLDYGADPSGE